MKARDIIPGWPRPKTTVSARGHWLYAETHPFMGGPRTAEMRDDLRRDAEYHRHQQEMVEGHRPTLAMRLLWNQYEVGRMLWHEQVMAFAKACGFIDHDVNRIFKDIGGL